MRLNYHQLHDKGERYMFATFKMSPNFFDEKSLEKYYENGIRLYDAQKRMVNQSLDQYLSIDGVLKAVEIEKEWFPEIKADIFLSHSHKDEKQIIALAGFLFSELGLRAFVDSCVWGYADKLLKEIDDKYCAFERNWDGTVELYDYQKRNQSTTHVHMILNGALMKMMDRTECLIFVDTPNSLQTKDISMGVTNSGWIYSELLMSSCLEKKQPVRKSIRHESYKSFKNTLNVEYDVNISHLIVLTLKDILTAFVEAQSNGTAILDQLYWMKGIAKK